jgi:hypothetical protein
MDHLSDKTQDSRLLLSRRTMVASMAATAVAPFVTLEQQAARASVKTAAPAEPLAREFHTTTETAFGTVVAGGRRHGALASVQVLSGGKWQDAAPLTTPRYMHAAIAWNGGVIVAGGLSVAGMPLSDVEFFDGSTWTRLGSLRTPRQGAALAIHLGTPIVTGGRNIAPLSSVEMFDGNGWQPFPSLTTPRFGHSAGLVNGVLTVTGGQNVHRLSSTESFNGSGWIQAAVVAPVSE